MARYRNEAPDMPLEPLVPRAPEFWLIPNGDALQLRNPVTLQPLHEMPTYISVLDDEGNQEWPYLQAEQDFWHDKNMPQMQLMGDIGPHSVLDDEPLLQGTMIDIYGSPVGRLDDGANSGDVLIDYGPFRNKVALLEEARQVATFNTLSPDDSVLPLPVLAQELQFMTLLGLADAATAYGRHRMEQEEAQARLRVAAGIVSLVAAEGWADAQQITRGLDQVYRERPELAERIPSTTYLHLHPRQRYARGALLALGAPSIILGNRNGNIFLQEMARVVSEVVGTSRITDAQFAALLEGEKRFKFLHNK